MGSYSSKHLSKPHAGGQLPYSNLKIAKSNTPTNHHSFSKYCGNAHPLYKILGRKSLPTLFRSLRHQNSPAKIFFILAESIDFED